MSATRMRALLGQHHENGMATRWAREAAIAAYDQACRAGSGLGCLSPVVMYNRGHGVEVDRAKAKTYLPRARKQLLAACQGSEPRWCAHAALALDGDDPATKAELATLEQRACARGAVASCVNILLIDRTPALVYEPGVVLSREVRDGVIGRIAAERLATEHQASAAVSSDALVAHLVGNSRAVEPDAAARVAAPDSPIAVQLIICVDETGALQDTKVTVAKTGVAAPASYVRAIQHAAEHWRWKPFVVRGKAVPICARDSFVYPADRWRRVALASSSVGPPVNGTLDGQGVSAEALDAHRIAGERQVMRTSWVYTPFWIEGRPASVCTAVTFVYSQR
jgi:hypothetical protein